MTVCEMLKKIHPHVFTKGGDRNSKENIPEWPLCEELDIEIITGVGGDKIQSSSWLIKNIGEK